LSDPLYRKEILRWAADAHGTTHVDSPDLTGIVHNPTCGDRVKVEIAIGKNGRITEFAQETKACVLTQASASILGDRLKGSLLEDVERLANDIVRMLASNGAPPPPPFEPYAVFEGAVAHRNRHRCVLLPIEAVLNAFDQEPNQAA
jgi:nitrogen fixation NifU-like protein